MITSRRKFLIGAGALFCAPAIVRASSLMPVRPLRIIEQIRMVGAISFTPGSINFVNLEGLVAGRWIALPWKPPFLDVAPGGALILGGVGSIAP